MLILLVLVTLIPVKISIDLWGEDPQVLVNNLGMLPQQDKIFLLQTKYDHDSEGTFSIFDANTKDLIYSGELSKEGLQWEKYYWV